MLFKKRHREDVQIAEGSTYRRVHPTNMVELAEVVWVGEDSAGIPHVRYNMSYLRGKSEDPQGTRILALDCFVERYHTTH